MSGMSEDQLQPEDSLDDRGTDDVLDEAGVEVPEDEDDRERSEWWKAKKWAYKILGRLFHRFGNPSQLPSSLQKDYGEFAEHFVTAFAPEIFKIYLEQIQLYVSGSAWLSKKCQYRIFTFFTEWYVD